VRVLLQSRRTLFTAPGGDTIQVLKTAEQLRSMGIVADISLDLEPPLGGYDLVHLFNLMRPQEAYLQALNARRRGRRIALSTIYVRFDEMDVRRPGFQGAAARVLRSPAAREYAKILSRAILNREWHAGTRQLLKLGFHAAQAKLLEWSDVLLPNSTSELARLLQDHPDAAHKAYVVVPNGIDTRLFAVARSSVQPPVAGLRDCVLCVGRIEPVKCQLELALAMRELPWPLVLIGTPAPNHRRYAARVLAAGGSKLHMLGGIEHGALPGYYAMARVHALVSWFETTGLSSLEAAAMGCALVITDKGDTRAYFGNDARYCDPASVTSIREAIADAYAASANPELRQRVLAQYTWERAAQATREGYERALSQG
jgi:glycosyltransferase involved in cell wall biosynthesis